MPATGETLRLEGFRELQRALAQADRTVRTEFRLRLRAVAEPVRSDAERLASAEISRIGVPWSRMRVGITRTSVYVAPVERGRRTRQSMRRPNLAGLLMGRAMLPALQQNEARTVAEVESMLADVGRDWGRGG